MMIYIISVVLLLSVNLAPNHFGDCLTQVSDIHHHNTKSASNGTFLQKEHFTFTVWLTLFVL